MILAHPRRGIPLSVIIKDRNLIKKIHGHLLELRAPHSDLVVAKS